MSSNFYDLGLGIGLFGLMQPPPPVMPLHVESPDDADGDAGLLGFSAPLPVMQDSSCGFQAMFSQMQQQMSMLMLQLVRILSKLQSVMPAAASASHGPAPQGLAKGLQVCGPVDGCVSGRFGEARPGHPHGHRGTDIAAPAGSPIRSVEAGTVSWAGWQRGYGLCVQVDHGHGRSTFYAHCSRIDVRPGQAVGAGSCIAKVGSTGHSTGPHLHFELREHGRQVDPSGLLARAHQHGRHGQHAHIA